MPSMEEFIYICNYLGVTPAQFFDEETEAPMLVNRLTDIAKRLSEEDLAALVGMAERLAE